MAEMPLEHEVLNEIQEKLAKYEQEKPRFVTRVGPRKSIQMLECLAQDHNARLRWMNV